MTRVRLLAALAAVGLLATAPAAFGALPSGNLVLNGEGEFGPSVANEGSAYCPQGWTCILGRPTLVQYGTTTFPSAAESARIGGGNNFFAGGPPGGPESVASPFAANLYQNVELVPSQPEIDAGAVQATLSACLGSWQDQNDHFDVELLFKSGSNGTLSTLGGAALRGSNRIDRGNATKLLPMSITLDVPPGSRSAHVELDSYIAQGPYNDGYADNVTLTLGPRPGSPPPAAACGETSGGPGSEVPGGGGPGPGGGQGGGGGKPGKGPTGVLTFGRATIGSDGKARVPVRCNTSQVSRCRGTLSVALVSASKSARKPKRKRRSVTYSVASLKKKTMVVPLRRADARAIASLSRRQLARRRLKLTATTKIGSAKLKQTALLVIARRD
jgi:hypothetical protein